LHVRELGRGTSGRVFQAVDDITGTEVAVKYLSDRLLGDNTFITRFREESRRLSHLEDPNLVDFYEYVESPTDGRAAIIIELVDGVSLRRVLATQGPTGPLGALAVFSGSLLAMAAAHHAGIVHRDFKPENVLVRRDGLSKVVDFGVASRAGGTAAYLAPEEWVGIPPSPASDLYSATAVFFECLTGRPPYPEQTSTAFERAHRAAPIPIEAVPGPLRDLVAAGLAKDPAARPASAADFLGHLEDAAVEAYGPAWEAQGRGRLAEMAAPASMAPWPPPAPPAVPRPPGRVGPVPEGGSNRAGMFIGVGAAAAVLVAAALAVYGVRSAGPGHDAADTGRTASPTPHAAGTRTQAAASTPARLAAQITRAVGGKRTASFTYRRTAGGADATSAAGVLRVTSKTAVAYDMTVWNPAGAADSDQRLRTVLVGGVAYVASGGWHPAPAVRLPARRDTSHLYGSMAANTRWATAPYDVVALLHASTSVKATAWTTPGGAAGGFSYSGVASAAKLGREPLVAPLYGPYPGGRYRVTYTIKVGADHLPQRLDVKVQPLTALGRPATFHVVYSHWGLKAAIKIPV
jgi:hypothetical protein